MTEWTFISRGIVLSLVLAGIIIWGTPSLANAFTRWTKRIVQAADRLIQRLNRNAYTVPTPPAMEDTGMDKLLRAAGDHRLPQQYCPKCQEIRVVFDGFCTVCGAKVLEALITEAELETEPDQDPPSD